MYDGAKKRDICNLMSHNVNPARRNVTMEKDVFHTDC